MQSEELLSDTVTMAIMTPHFCSMTEESLYNMATVVAQGVLDVLEGRRPQYPVNP